MATRPSAPGWLAWVAALAVLSVSVPAAVLLRHSAPVSLFDGREAMGWLEALAVGGLAVVTLAVIVSFAMNAEHLKISRNAGLLLGGVMIVLVAGATALVHLAGLSWAAAAVVGPALVGVVVLAIALGLLILSLS